MGRRILTISNSPFASLEDAGPSRRIWAELAAGAEEYHVLARNRGNRFGSDRAGNLRLHLVPELSSAAFGALSYAAAALVRRHRIDAIVCQDPVLGGVAGVHVGRAFGLPVMVEIHTDLYFRLLGSAAARDRPIALLARHALRQATVVRLVARNFAPLVAAAGVPEERMAYVPYRVDLDLFHPSAARSAGDGATAGDPLLLSIGRFVEQKGYAVAIEALARVRAERPGARLVLVGGGPLEARYREVAAAAGVADAVELVRWLPQERLLGLLGAADVYLQPSVPGRGEAMPRTILEAMAMARPVVASAIAGIPDVIRPGRNGVLVPPADAVALADAVLGLASDPARRERLGAAARADAEAEYAWGPAFDRYRDAVLSMTRS